MALVFDDGGGGGGGGDGGGGGGGGDDSDGQRAMATTTAAIPTAKIIRKSSPRCVLKVSARARAIWPAP